MRRTLAHLLVVLTLCSAAAAEDVRQRTRIEAQPPTWVGQRVTLVVELLSPTFFSGTPSFDLPTVPGVLIAPPADRPVLGSETIDGQAYTVQRHELSVISQRDGDVTLPAFTVRFAISAGIGKPPEDEALSTSPVKVTFKQPPGMMGVSPVISTSQLTVDDNWSQSADQLKVGDAITHSVTLHADDVPGMLLPPMKMPAVQGLKTYRKSPAVADQSERGTLTGQRAETFTFVCSAPGTFTVPAYALKWWNVQTQTVETITISGKTLNVAAVAPPATDLAKPVRRHWGKLIGGGAVAIGLLSLAFLAWRRWRRAWNANVERSAFNQLKKACHSNQPAEVIQALANWQAITGVRLRDDPQLAVQIDRLERHLYGTPPAAPLGGLLVEIWKQIRSLRHRARGQHRRERIRLNDLAELNPSSTVI